MKYYILSNILFRLINNKLIIIILLNLLSFNNCQYGLQSPCPNVLIYQQDNSGIIKVDNYITNNINSLTVRTTSNNRFANAKLELTQSQNEIFNAVQRRSPVYLRLITEDGSTPNVLDIVSNGEKICTSTGFRLTSIFTVTHRLTLQSNVGNTLSQFNPTPSQNNDVFTNVLYNGMPVSQFTLPQNSEMIYSPNPLQQPTSNFNPLFYDPLQWQQPTEQQQSTLGRVSTPSNPWQQFTNTPPSNRRGSTSSNRRGSTPSNLNPLFIESAESTKPNQNPLFSESPDICGTTTLRVPLIFNGQVFQPGSWPWLTVLFRRSTKTFDCGGSLISHTSVITAAHCFPNATNERDYVMGIGVYDIKQRQEDGATFQNIKNIRKHPLYKIELLASYADIAIVTLQGSIEYNRRIKPICLWNTATDFDRIANKIGIVAGWGLTDPKGSPSSDTPTYATAKIVSYTDCIVSNPAFGQITSNTTLCAGFRNGTGPCRGDSGNGLMVEESGKWYLTGIVSQSFFDQTNVCKLDDYVVYTNVLNLIEWIQRYMTE